MSPENHEARRRRISPFILIAFTIILIWFAYLGHQLVGLTELELSSKIIFWLVLALPFGAVFWLPLFHWRDDDPTPARLRSIMVWVSFLSMGYLSLLLFASAIRDVAWLATRSSTLYGTHASVVVLAAAVLLLAFGRLFAHLTPRVKHVRVPLAGLPPAFSGYRIVQLTDLHIGATVRRPFVERVVEKVNSLGPDLIALTGDIFEGDVAEIGRHVEPLGRLRATDGSFFVTGNHEYYWGAEQWLKQLPGLGIRALGNAHVTISRAGARILLAGVNDLWATGHRDAAGVPLAGADPAGALTGAPADIGVRILLAHQPSNAYAASKLGYSLQLSGHTHGGQFIPWVFFAPLIHHKLTAGLSQLRGMWVYVSRGTGSWGPPIRLGAPSEITLIELVSVAGPRQG